MTSEIDDEHLQMLSRNFQENVQEVADMFVVGVTEYSRMCNSGSSTKPDCGCSNTGCSRDELRQEQLKVKKDTDTANQEKAALINLLRNALKISHAVKRSK